MRSTDIILFTAYKLSEMRLRTLKNELNEMEYTYDSDFLGNLSTLLQFDDYNSNSNNCSIEFYLNHNDSVFSH